MEIKFSKVASNTKRRTINTITNVTDVQNQHVWKHI